MSLLPNLDELNDEQKMAVLESVQKSIAQSKEIQKRKIAENVDLVVQALKKIESDIRSRYDDVGNAIEKRVASIKDGRDGIDGKDGRDGKDGKQGKDGRPGRDGKDGKNGLDGQNGEDGVSVVNAHIDFDGSLIISLSTGKEINVGEVVAPALAEQIKVITNGGGTSQSVLDTLTSLQSQIDALSGATIYKGLWNASTNTPALTSSVGTSGNFYIVSVAGSTNLNGITNWDVGDWAIFNGSVWQRVEGGANGNFTTLSVSGVATFSAGTVSAPAITTSGDTNTGVYFPAADTVGITAGGTQRGAFSSTGLSVTGALSATGFSVVNSAASLLRATINASNVTAQQVDIAFTNSGGSTYIGQDAAGYSFIDARGALNAITFGYSGAVVTTIGSTGLTMASGMSVRGANNLTLNATAGNSVISQVNNVTVTSVSSTGLAVTGALSTTGVATFPAGTVALPSITTSGDTNTGVYFPAADTIAFTEGGAEAMRIDSAGRLLIAFSTSNAAFGGKLQYEDTNTSASLVRYSTSAGGAPSLYMARSKGAAVGTNTIVASGDTLGGIVFSGANGTGYSDAAYIQCFVDGTPGASADMPGRLVFSTSSDGSATPAERMRIDSSGNVGIGTNTPSTYGKFSAVSASPAIYRFMHSGNGGSDSVTLSLGSDNSSYLSSHAILLATQNGGVTGYLLDISSSGTNSRLTLQTSGTNNYLGFNTSGSERMRINSSGNVGIGTASPGAKLDVQGGQGGISNPANGTVNVVDTTSAAQGVGGQIVFRGNYTGTTATQYGSITAYKESATVDGTQYGASLIFNTRTQGGNNTEKMRIDSSGNVGIGTSSPTSRLQIGDSTVNANNILRFGKTASASQSTLPYISQVSEQFVGVSNDLMLFAGGSGAGRVIVNSNDFVVKTGGGTSPSGAERMRIDSSGNVLVGKASATANGGDVQVSSGITFPATQVSKSDANTLDDYEEGTWTPSIGGTATYTTQLGFYTKIGRQVTITFDLNILVLGTGSTSSISGAPFTPAAGGNYYTGSVFWENIASSQISVGTFIQGTTGTIFFYTRSTAGTSVVNASAIIGSGTILRCTMTYFI